MPFADPEFRTDIERMLVYLGWSRSRYLALFERLPWKVLTRKRGSTFESIRDVHLHVLLVYASWLYHFFGQRSLKSLEQRLARNVHHDVRSVTTLKRFNRQIDECALRTARRLGPGDFDRKKQVNSGHGAVSYITPREVFWHMIEEDFLHHGEILCMLWQDNIEPPYTGVWWFEYDHDPARHPDLAYSNPKFPRPSAGGYVRPRRPKTGG